MTYASSNPAEFVGADQTPGVLSTGQLGIIVFSLATPTFAADDDPLTFGSCWLGDFDPSICLGGRSDFQLLGEDFQYANGSGSAPIDALINFNLELGRFVFVEVFAVGLSRFGSSFDSMHTVTSAFDSLEGLTLLQTVPEPPTPLLVLLALAGLATARRPKSR